MKHPDTGVLSFDNIAINDEGPVPNGYGGLHWNNCKYIKKSCFPGSGFDRGVVSGDYAAYNPASQPLSVDGILFTFLGVYLTSGWQDNNPIAVQGYSGGSKKYERVVVISKDGPAWFDFNFTNIDELRLFSLSTGNAHFVIDDFSYIRLRKAMPWIPLLLLDD